MEAAICTLVSQFKTFAGKDGSSSTLSKEEFHNLVTSQLPNFVKVDPEGRREPNAAVKLTLLRYLEIFHHSQTWSMPQHIVCFNEPNRLLSRSFSPLWFVVIKCSLLFGSGGAERPAKSTLFMF